ncbi:hypothetical protein ATKI12_0078 [Kitasatospora sp. Ki12]
MTVHLHPSPPPAPSRAPRHAACWAARRPRRPSDPRVRPHHPGNGPPAPVTARPPARGPGTHPDRRSAPQRPTTRLARDAPS